MGRVKRIASVVVVIALAACGGSDEARLKKVEDEVATMQRELADLRARLAALESTPPPARPAPKPALDAKCLDNPLGC